MSSLYSNKVNGAAISADRYQKKPQKLPMWLVNGMIFFAVAALSSSKRQNSGETSKKARAVMIFAAPTQTGTTTRAQGLKIQILGFSPARELSFTFRK